MVDGGISSRSAAGGRNQRLTIHHPLGVRGSGPSAPIISLRTPAGQSGSEARRAAFENVGDVNLGSGDVYTGQQLVE